MREDWIECTIKDISKIINGDRGKNYPSRTHYVSNGLPFVSAGNINDSNKLEKSSLNFISQERFDLLKGGFLKQGDILFCIRGSLGKLAIYDLDIDGAIASSLVIVRRLKSVEEKYLLYYLSSFSIKLFINEFNNGTAQPNLSAKDFSNFKFPLPPLPEQRAIVKKLESLFSSLDAGVADLKKAQQQLKIYRQSVLKKAFEGEMTKGWREKNSYNMDDFLQELKNKKVTAIKEKLISKGDYFPNYKLEQLNFTTPNSWLSLPWKTLTSNRKYALKRGPFGSALKKDFFVESGTVVYEQGHAINDDPYRHRYFITPEKFEELKAFAVGAGDLIISCSGATLGRICLLPEDAEVGVINQALLKVDLDEEVILKKYFLILFRSESFQRLIFSKALGSAMPNMVGMEELKEMPIPIPSILEQKEIVKQIESRLSVCDSIEQNIKESLVKAEALRQSILKKSFEGNLLTAQQLAECKQAADYEPASVLLERIKAEQNKVTAKPSKKKVTQPLVVAKIETPVAKISADIHAGLIAKVIKIHEENPASIDNLSHIKCEKIAHLVEYHLQIPLGRKPVKDAAGPDDYPHLKKIEHRAKMANYFAIQKKEIGYSYSSAKNSDKAIDKFQSALSDEKNKQLDDLIALFLKFDLEVSEIIATTYAGWNNLILNGNANPSDEEIVYESRENWSERKLKIARERFFKAIDWMRKNEIVPTGYGAVVPFPKKKK
ncbi:restriction endonuclease subunit S [Chryseobacterium sp. JAH]|uniref:restriction endonuclease subunit S n=1 Tax=Chryseobacterium sp. JAH TaxID=1742858 RepID=UPI000740ECE1|nr:restriction endonuclease subunit S [Chryseobacterium sp. JAH]KUJ50918.1 hypothetical protein AR685_11825 [Chryseobacterium sp. JAH]